MNTSLLKAILPCPLCKTTRLTVDVTLREEGYKFNWYYITCVNCYLSSPLRDSEKTAIKLWNNLVHKIAKLEQPY